MRGAVGGFAAAVFLVAIGQAAERPAAKGPAPQEFPHVLFFAGGDGWRAGAFAHAGMVWSPAGLFHEGLVLKLLTAAGSYRYRTGGAADIEVRGVLALDAIMAGWRFKSAQGEATVFGGLDLQHHRLSPDDPGNRLRGFHAGFRAEAGFWYQPSPKTMLALNLSASTIGPSYWSRVATGLRLGDAVWLGPEAEALGGPTHQQYRFGLHVTALRTGAFEWSAGFGFAADADRRRGLYGRLGVLLRR